MKISVITVTIDEAGRLRPTLESVARQTHRGIEHIVVDGLEGREFAEFPAIRRVYEPPTGIYAAINAGLSQASGDVIGLVHGGDRLASDDILAKVNDAFDGDPSLDFVYGDIVYVNSRGHRGRIYRADNFKPGYLAYGMAPPHPSLYIRRKAAARLGLYREEFRLAADLDMWMRIFADRSIKGRYMPEVFVEMAGDGLSSSWGNRLINNNKEKLRALSLNGYSANPLKLLGKYVIIVRDLFRKHRKS